MKRHATLVWFRHDLRLVDYSALTEAVKSGGALIPVFIWSPDDEGEWSPGGPSKWWLHQSVMALQHALHGKGLRLVARSGPALRTLSELIGETGDESVFWSRRYEPALIPRDAKVKESLRSEGIKEESFNGALLHEPWTIQNKSGKPFQVFTPFWKHCLGKPDPTEPLPAPKMIPSPKQWPKSLRLAELELEPRINLGRRVVARMPHRISACSIRRARARSLIRMATMCAAGVLNSRSSRRNTSTRRTKRRWKSFRWRV